MRMFAIAAFALLSAGSAYSQVYKCPAPGGGSTYTDKPCDVDATPHQVRTSSFGGSAHSGEMHLSGTNCTRSHGYTTGTGYIVNQTPEPREAAVTTTFTRVGTVIDTMTHSKQVAAHGRTAFSMTVGGNADRCEYSIRWK